ncbi:MULTISPECIES: DUF924 family protein [Cyanophyceae]|uniref:DUF924 domain-containing protein n=1 Tax=Leptolyngbya subtilissima DQ-A4 TaxID=2933933 RepID=A0ABV0K3I4_9CYAN|nr:DUF924 family protein [Nodosilinea sp. FACHB-141]MBD2113215.1 DUF924 domain-containing protein [Nodosilinea sp. FACHB-141]
MTIQPFETVLQFWFPDQLNQGQAAIVRQWQWWFRGGMSASENERFLPLLEQAIRGDLDHWAEEPRSRLALIILLDQFSRAIYQGTAKAFAQDAKACLLALEGINVGHYSALITPWEKTFFLLPLGHSESLKKLDLAVQLVNELVQEALPEHRELLAFSASQARAHREVIARFGRQPHRNALLGRVSTPEELDYLATGQLVHTRSMPPHLSALLNDA